MLDKDNMVYHAIDSVLGASLSYCKFLSANDSGETNSHQVGILISMGASRMLFTDQEMKNNHILKKDVHIKWQDDLETLSCFTWYESKHELRITRFGRGFPYLIPEYTGALFVLTHRGENYYDAFILNDEDSIQEFLDAFGLTPVETNRIIETKLMQPNIVEHRLIDQFISGLREDFPSSIEMSREAQLIQQELSADRSLIKRNPDKVLLDWTDEEYRLFRTLENARYGALVSAGFTSVDEFISLANQVLNRRKSRAGKSLEHHLSAIFDGNGIQYTSQGITEGNKRPDFIFPSMEAYHNTLFPIGKLCTLAAKTTCKDRWRQVLNEADRLRDQNKYLCTMQQGISLAQLNEMQAERVILVVPKLYIASYPKEKQSDIWTLAEFIGYVREMEGL